MQCEEEREAASFSFACLDSAFVHFYSIFHDSQSESCSSECATSPFVDAVEAFEDAR